MLDIKDLYKITQELEAQVKRILQSKFNTNKNMI